MADIELRLFRYFVVLAQERHFAHAAARLGITPPTLTHQIQKLERIVGMTLIKRSGNATFELTSVGKRFFDESEKVLAQAENAQLAARKAARGEIGRINVGFMVTAVGSGVLQKHVDAFQQRHPEIEIALRQMMTLDQVKAILDNDLDFGFARPPAKYPSALRGMIVHRQPIMVAMPVDHALARQKQVRPEQLKDEFFVNTTIEMELGFQRHAEAIADLGKFPLKVSKRVADMPTMLTYVSLGYGLAIVTEGLSAMALPNITYRRLVGEGVPSAPLALIYRRRGVSPAAQAFIDFVSSRTQHLASKGGT